VAATIGETPFDAFGLEGKQISLEMCEGREAYPTHFSSARQHSTPANVIFCRVTP